MSANDKDVLELAKWAAKAAKSRGAADVRVNANRGTECILEWRDGKVDRVRESTTLSLEASLFVDGRYSVNTTSDIRKPALEKFLDETIAMTRALARDPHRVLPDASRYANRFAGDLKLRAPGAEATSAAFRRRAVADLEKAARSGPGAAKIVSVTTACSNAIWEWATVASNGMEGTDAQSSFALSASVSVGDAGGRKPRDYSSAVCCASGSLPSAEQIGRDAAERTMRRIGARPRETRDYPCVIEARCVNNLVGGLLAALQGNNIQQKRSFLADKLDQGLTNALMTLVDDPYVVGGLGSRLFDNEGMTTQKRVIVDKGVLKHFYLDTYYAHKLKMEPTSGGTTNLLWDLGKRDLAGLIEQMGTGLLITGFNGGNSNSATGDFSTGVSGMWIEGGKAVSPIAEMNLTGNHLTFWKKLLEVGSDAYVYSSHRHPSLRFDNVQFSGTGT